MLINIGGILLVLTLTSYTQAVREPMRNNLKIKPKSDDLSDDLFINRRQENSTGPKKKETTFENYLRKFEPSMIWEQIDKQKKYKGLILSQEEHTETMIQAMDPTDEIMALKIENGKPNLIFDQGPGGRRYQGWNPPNHKGYVKDPFYIRNRMYELMKQAIYTTRNNMVIMQIYRENYRNSSLYKQGFLMNKADNAANTFGKYSFRAYRSCLMARERVQYRIQVADLLSANERQLNLWFNIELLADIITNNDVIARAIFRNTLVNRTGHLDQLFID